MDSERWFGWYSPRQARAVLARPRMDMYVSAHPERNIKHVPLTPSLPVYLTTTGEEVVVTEVLPPGQIPRIADAIPRGEVTQFLRSVTELPGGDPLLAHQKARILAILTDWQSKHGDQFMSELHLGTHLWHEDLNVGKRTALDQLVKEGKIERKGEIGAYNFPDYRLRREVPHA